MCKALRDESGSWCGRLPSRNWGTEGLLLGELTTWRAFLFGRNGFQSGREKKRKSSSLTWMCESNKEKEGMISDRGGGRLALGL